MRFLGVPRASHLLVGASWLALSMVCARAASAKDDDHSVAESTLREVEANPRGKELAKEPLARAHEALDRAQRLRDVRDEPRARLCDGLARTWAETARDVMRAAETEGRSEGARAAANDAGAQVERERALLEEGLGQQGRLRAQLETLERETKRRPDRTSAVAKDDAKTPKGPPAPKAPAADPRKPAIPGDLPDAPAPKKLVPPALPVAPKKGPAK